MGKKNKQDTGSEKRIAIVRTKLVAILVILILCGVLFRFFLAEKLIKSTIEGSLEPIFQSRVELEKISLSLWRGAFTIKRFSIGDGQNDWQNLLEIDSIKGQADWADLLKGKIHIPLLEISGLQLGSPRHSSALRGMGKKAEKPSKFKALLMKQADRLLSAYDAQETGVEAIDASFADALKNFDRQVTVSVQRTAKSIRIASNKLQASAVGPRLEQLRTDLNRLRESFPDKIDAVPAYGEKLKLLVNNAEDLQMQVSGVVKAVDKAGSTLDGEVASLKSQAASGIKRIRQTLAQNTGGSTQLMGLVLGPQLAEKLEQLGRIVAIVSRLKGSGKGNKTELLARGRTVAFPLKEPVPNFWIEQANLTGKNSQGQKFSGELREWVSDQTIRQKPARLFLQWEPANRQNKTLLTSILDLRGEKPHLVFDYSQISLDAKPAYWDQKIIPMILTDGSISIFTRGTFIDDRLSVSMNIRAKALGWTKASSFRSYKGFHEILDQVTQHADQVGIDFYLSGDQVRFASTLDKIFAKASSAYLQEQVDRLQEITADRWEMHTNDRIMQAQNLLDARLIPLMEKTKVIKDNYADLELELRAEQRRVESELNRIQQKILNKLPVKLP